MLCSLTSRQLFTPIYNRNRDLSSNISLIPFRGTREA